MPLRHVCGYHESKEDKHGCIVRRNKLIISLENMRIVYKLWNVNEALTTMDNDRHGRVVERVIRTVYSKKLVELVRDMI